MSKLILLAACALSAAAVAAMAALSDGDERGVAVAEARPAATAELQTPPPAGGAFPNTDDGLPLMQVGPTWATWPSELDRFNNMLIDAAGWSARQDWPGQEVMNFGELYLAGFIDPETMLPTGIPDGFDFVQSGLMRDARNYPDYYAGRYVLEWEGDADLRFGLGRHGEEKRDGPRRKYLDRSPAQSAWFPIEIRRIGPEGLKAVAVFNEKDEAALKAGDIWTRKWVGHIEGYKILRDMDMMQANTSLVTEPDDIAPYSGLLWVLGSKTAPAGVPASTPLRAIFDLAVLSDTALWHNVPPFIGADKERLYEIGQMSDWRARGDARKDYAKKNAVLIADSPKWRAYADHLVASMIEAGYPADRTLYIELANEIWNFANPFGENTHYFWSLGEGLEAAGRLERKGEIFRNALGWMTAQMATHVSAALAEAGRGDQPVVFVLASQNAYHDRTDWALHGFKAYFDWKGEDAGPWLARTGVSTASYFDGAAFEKDAAKGGFFPAASDEARDAAWIAAIERDPEGLKRRLTDYIISGPANQGGTLPWVVRNRAAHQEIAERYGAFFLGDYEGHSHLNPPASLNDPRFVNWFEAWSYGPHMAEITHAWVKALREQNPEAAISNYAVIGAVDPEGDSETDAKRPAAWLDHMWGEENDRTRAFDEYLRKRED